MPRHSVQNDVCVRLNASRYGGHRQLQGARLFGEAVNSVMAAGDERRRGGAIQSRQPCGDPKMRRCGRQREHRARGGVDIDLCAFGCAPPSRCALQGVHSGLKGEGRRRR